VRADFDKCQNGAGPDEQQRHDDDDPIPHLLSR
jgi:hypothetical protein